MIRYTLQRRAGQALALAASLLIMLGIWLWGGFPALVVVGGVALLWLAVLIIDNAHV